MQAVFDAQLFSRPTCRLAPMRPTRKDSIDKDEQISVSLLPTAVVRPAAPHDDTLVTRPDCSPTPTRGSLQREKRISPVTSLKPTQSMTMDHISRDRQASIKSIALNRVSCSCDRIPTMPMRVATPMKARRYRQMNFSARESSLVGTFEIEKYLKKEGDEKEEDSPAIRNPQIISNMFLQGMSPFVSLEPPIKHQNHVENSLLKCKQRTRTISHVNQHPGSTNILGAAELDDNESSYMHHLISLSRTSSSSLSLSSSFELLLNIKEN